MVHLRRTASERFCRISERRWARWVNCGVESWTNRDAQLQKDALSDRRDPDLRQLVCGLPAELPAFRGDHGSARRVGRPFFDQSMSNSPPTAHRKNGPQTQAAGRRQLGRWTKRTSRSKGVWRCLYRAADKQGKTFDFVLTGKRDMAGAKCFFDKTMGANGDPDKVATNKSGATKVAIDLINAGHAVTIRVRRCLISNHSAPLARCSPASG